MTAASVGLGLPVQQGRGRQLGLGLSAHPGNPAAGGAVAANSLVSFTLTAFGAVRAFCTFCSPLSALILATHFSVGTLEAAVQAGDIQGLSD